MPRNGCPLTLIAGMTVRGNHTPCLGLIPGHRGLCPCHPTDRRLEASPSKARELSGTVPLPVLCDVTHAPLYGLKTPTDCAHRQRRTCKNVHAFSPLMRAACVGAHSGGVAGPPPAAVGGRNSARAVGVWKSARRGGCLEIRLEIRARV